MSMDTLSPPIEGADATAGADDTAGDAWTAPSQADFEAMQAQISDLRRASEELTKLKADTAGAAEAARIANGEAATVAADRQARIEALEGELETSRAAETARVKLVAARVKERLAAIPEAKRGLLPSITHLSPDAQISYLDANLALILPDARPAGPGPRGGTLAADIPVECLTEARSQQEDPATWLKYSFFRDSKVGLLRRAKYPALWALHASNTTH